MASRRPYTRLHRNESPFGTTAGVLRAWEKQRTADRHTIGLNRYADFLSTDIIVALQRYYGLTELSYTPLAGSGEVGAALAAAVFRTGGELVQSWPIYDPLSVAARAWGATVRRVPLTAGFAQDLDALAAAVGPKTKLVHVASPHDPAGGSLSHSDLTAFVGAVAKGNAGAYVWVEGTFAEYSTGLEPADPFALIADDPKASMVCTSRSLSGAHGLAGLPTAYLAASQALTQETDGVTSGYVVSSPGYYGWANPEGNMSRMGEKALIALLGAEGREHLADVRARNHAAREEMRAMLIGHGFTVALSDSAYLFARPPGRFRRGGLAPALRRERILVRSPPANWGARYRGFVRISVGTAADRRRLDRALAKVLAAKPKRRTNLAPVAAAGLFVRGRGHPATVARLEAAAEPAALRHELTRRRLLAAGGAAGLALMLGRLPRAAQAFPPDEFFDRFDLVRMIYHENPVGPHAAALDAVKSVIGRGPGGARAYVENDDSKLVDAILAYNRTIRASSRRLRRENTMLLLGSAEGLTLTADTFVAGRTLVSEWPAYRIIRERVLQARGRVVDVLCHPDDQPDYDGILKALQDHPEAGLIHFNAQNNPLGSVMQRAPFEAFAKRVYAEHPHVVILADESDLEYMDAGYLRQLPDFQRHVADGKNLVHLQTFSHAFGLTGLRLGYLFAPPRLIARMKRKRIAQPTSEFARAAGLATLKVARDQVGTTQRIVSASRRDLYAEFDRLGLKYRRSQGHYIMVDTGRNSTQVWLSLIALGVLVRDGREWGLGTQLRVNPGLPEENRRFVAALRDVLGRTDLSNPGTLPVDPSKLLGGGGTGGQLARMAARNQWFAERLPAFADGRREFTLDDLMRK
jgi:histidinol-phosphate aminotransferase